MDFDKDFGRYELVKVIGQGGLGTVFLAKDKNLDREVAIKILNRSLGHEAENRFIREIEICLRLQHPNVISIYDGSIERGKAFYTMEYLPNQDLAQLIEDGPFELAQASSIVLRLAEALAYLHGEGVLHRDVKPQNVLLKDDGQPVLMDFNLGLDLTRTGLTVTGMCVGTPKYMAPELASGSVYSESTEVYALGVLFHNILAGTMRSFDSNKVPLSKLNHHVTKRIEEFLHWVTNPNPEERCQSMEDFKTSMQSLCKEDSEVSTVVEADTPKRHSRLRRAVFLLLLSTTVLFFYSVFQDERKATLTSRQQAFLNMSLQRKLSDKIKTLISREAIPSVSEAAEIGRLVVNANELESHRNLNIPAAIGLHFGFEKLRKKNQHLQAIKWAVALLDRYGQQLEPLFFLTLCKKTRDEQISILPIEKRSHTQRKIIEICQHIRGIKTSRAWQRTSIYCEILNSLDLPFNKKQFKRKVTLVESELEEDGNVVGQMSFNALYIRLLQKQPSKDLLLKIEHIIDKFRPQFSKDQSGAFDLLCSAADFFGDSENEFDFVKMAPLKAVEYAREAKRYTSTKEEVFSIGLLEAILLRDASKPRDAYLRLKSLTLDGITQPQQLHYYLQVSRTCRQLGLFAEALQYLKSA